MSDEAGEKSEQATQQRRDEFRRRGDVVQTKELSSFLFLLAGAICVWTLSRYFLDHTTEMITQIFKTFIIPTGSDVDWRPAAVFIMKQALYLLAPLFCLSMLIAFLSSVVQVGFVANEEAMQFNFERLNPITGLQRIFSLRAVVEGVKSVLKLSILLVIAYFTIRKELKVLPHITNFNTEEILSFLGRVILQLLISMTVFMAALAVLDYAYQWWDLEKRMRMSKQEIKEETKNREGDPLIKSRIRRLQREVAQRKMMKDVPKADVIVTNPTHIAVALKYDNNSPAPRVIAKGADLVAEKIKELAREHRIPIVENKPLARTIYKTIKIGQWIPRELFHAVAEVLAYVYRLKKKKWN